MAHFFSALLQILKSLRKTEDPFISSFLLIVLNFIPVSVRIFLIPIYLNKLSAEDYGILNLVNTTANFLQIFAGLGIAHAVVSLYFDYNNNREKLKQYLGNILAFSILASSLFLLISYFLGPWLFNQIFDSGDLKFFPYGFLAIGAMLCGLISSCYFVFLKNDRNILEYACFALASVIFNLIFQSYLIVYENMGVMGALWGAFLSQAIILLVVLGRAKGFLNFSIKREYIIRSLKYSIPLIPYHFILKINTRIDRFFIEHNLGIEKVGQYAALMGIAGIIYLVTIGINTGMRPFLFGYYKEGAAENNENIKSLIRLYIGIGILAASGIIFLGNNIQVFTDNPKYLEITSYVALATMVTFIRCYWMLFNQTLIYKQESATVSRLIFISLCLLLVLFYFLIPRFGILGALMASLITDIITGIFFYRAAQKLFFIQYDFRILIVIPLCFYSLILAMQYLVLMEFMSPFYFSLIQLSIAIVFGFFILKKDINKLLHAPQE